MKSLDLKKTCRAASALAAIIAVALGATPVFAQRTAAAGPKKASTCSGAWTGVVRYNRTQTQTDNKTVPRVSARGEDTRDWQMKYDYSASVSVVESPERDGSTAGKASVQHSLVSTEKVSAVESNSCDRGKTWKQMTGTSVSRTETTGQAGGIDANVYIGVNTDGTYTVSVAIPQIKGQTTGSQSSVFSGQCTPKEGKNLTMPPTDVTIDGNSLTSDGTNRLDPSDPNRASGSYSKTWMGVTETISWNLQKCGAPLRLTDLKFEHPKFPNFNDWQEIVEQTGTIDGNLVKIKATVLNASGETKYADIRFKETFKGDKWDGAKPDAQLSDNVVSTRLEAGETRDVEMVWDSSGYAWFDDGRPRLVQRIKAELEENGKKSDEMTRNLKVAPKPLVLVHGLWSNWKAWETWQNILTTSHSYDWKAFPVGEVASKGKMNTGGAFLSTDPTNSIFENSQELGKYIKYAQEDRNAWHVDLVAHSMGGLISRHYIHHFMPTQSADGRPQVSHLIMLGTPNLGSPCADVMNTAFEFLGKDVEAVRQLRQDVASEFNRVTTNRNGVRFSALAGNPLPVMCKQYVWNDGVVPVESAKWKVADNALSKNVHTELTGTVDFSNFVKPRLAIGPKGNHMPQASGTTAGYRFVGESAFVMASYGRPGPLASAGAFAKSVKLGPKRSVEIEIPVEDAGNFGITFMADPRVSATLIDASGTTVGKNLAGSPEASAWFRSIFVDRPTASGTWKLTLQNTADLELESIITTWKDAVR